MSRFVATLALTSSAVVSLGLVASLPAWAATASAPQQITARPDSVMVNATTKLTGTHFATSKRLTVEECSMKLWVVTTDPCNTAGEAKVRTSSQGGFRTTLTVDACQGGSTPGFSETCYVGVPTPSGVDTITLEGAVAITVTGP